MKTIKSNDILESFGMKDLKIEEIMEIDSGTSVIPDGCGIKFGCLGKVQPCSTRIVECPSKSFICTMKIN